MKNSKGITLIAMIITIIVMLILAVVVVNIATEGQIFETAQNATKETEKQAIYENVLSSIIYNQDGTIDKQATYNTIKSNFESQGMTVSELGEDGIFSVTGKNGINKFKITDRNIELLGEDSGGNGDGDPVITQATVGTIVENNCTINGEAYSSTNPIIPAGFAPINITTTGQEAYWDAEGGPQVNNGLVITDNVTLDESGKVTIGSEFVWVPVPEINKMIMCQEHGASVTLDKETLQCPTCGENTKLAGKLCMDVNNSVSEFDSSATGQRYINAIYREPDILKNDETYITKEELQNEFDNMAKSVAKYGGFYVGRYEMSLTSGGTAQSKYGAISSNASQEDTNMWYGLYSKAKTYINGKNSVQSTMIWGSQYDAMILWMENNGINVNENIGNLRNNERISGKAPKDVIKNIYDLYGNSFEYTREIFSLGRVARGGKDSTGMDSWFESPSYRVNSEDGAIFQANAKHSLCSTRFILYIL